MAYNIQTLKNDLSGVLHGTQLNQIQNLNGVINRAARQLLLDVDPQETKRILEFVNPIFNGVYDYPIAPDVKGNTIIDIRPQVRRLPRDIWLQGYNQAFDIAKQNIYNAGDAFTLNFNTGIKTLRINSPFLNPPIILNYIEDVTENGTWFLSGDVSNLQVDNVNFVAGSGSLSFTFDSGGSQGEVINGTMNPINLSSIENQGALFFWVYFTDASVVASVALSIGNSTDGTSSNDYWASPAITTNQQGTAFVNGWNLIQVNWTSLTPSGSPDVTSINYAEMDIVATAPTAIAQVMRVNLIDAILGSILEYEYYSKYMFRDAITGAFQETVTDDSNLINLDTESFNLLFNLVAFLATQQQQGLDASFYDGSFFGNAYQDALVKYKARYKSEIQKPQSTYYSVPPAGYSRIIGRQLFY